MAIRKFKCGHSRTVQPYKQTVVHKINGDCPQCSSAKQKLERVEVKPRGKILKLA